MDSIQDYIDAAKKRTGCSSDEKLSALLGLSKNGVFFWKKKGILPSDESMMKLAKLAGVEPWQALIDLNMWRAPNENVRKTYSEILQKIVSTILIIVATGVVSTGKPAQAVPLDVSKDKCVSIYYGKYYIIFRRGALFIQFSIKYVL